MQLLPPTAAGDKRRQRDTSANTNILGLRRNMGSHDMDGRTDAVGAKMMFRQPHGVVTGFIHQLDTVKRAFINLRQWYTPTRPAKKLQNSKFHDVSSPQTP
jgi:hypothetical protein